MRWALNIFIILLLLKIFVGTFILFDSDEKNIPLSTSKAIASEKSTSDKGKVKKDKTKVIIYSGDISREAILRKKAELERKEKELKMKEAELLIIQKDITEKIARLERLRNEIKAENEKRAFIKEKRFKHLVKVYSSMKPASAAKLIEKLDTRVAVELLSKMKGDIAGNILSYMNVEKAAKISEGLFNKK